MTRYFRRLVSSSASNVKSTQSRTPDDVHGRRADKVKSGDAPIPGMLMVSDSAAKFQKLKKASSTHENPNVNHTTPCPKP